MSLREPAPGSRSARGRVPVLYPGSAPTGHRWGPISSTPAASLFPQSTPTPIPRSGRSPNAQIQTSSPGFSISTNSWGWWRPQHPGPALPQPRSASLGPGLAAGRSPPFPRSPSPSPGRPAKRPHPAAGAARELVQTQLSQMLPDRGAQGPGLRLHARAFATPAGC